MKLFVIFTTLIAVCASQSAEPKFQLGYAGNEEFCIDSKDAAKEFRKVFDPFLMHVFRTAPARGGFYLTLCPIAMWITVAAIAEGADLNTQKEMFRFLNLPDSACSRKKLYQVATTRITTSEYVNVVHTRALVIDEDAQLNPQWNSLIRDQSLLQVIQAPLKKDPVTTTNIIQKLIGSTAHQVDLKGNSVLLNSFDFSGLWAMAFSDAVVERAPFHDLTGKKIGAVDLMKVRRRARIGYSAGLNTKVVELHVGKNNEYSIMILAVINNEKDVAAGLAGLHNDTLNEILASLHDTGVPIDISVPRFSLNSETNMKDVLEDMGLKSIWKDPAATRYISTPSALPSSYIQRASITLNTDGIAPAPYEPPSIGYQTQPDKFWTEFVADKPFLVGIYDTETYTCLSGSLYTRPTYPL